MDRIDWRQWERLKVFKYRMDTLWLCPEFLAVQHLHIESFQYSLGRQALFYFYLFKSVFSLRASHPAFTLFCYRSVFFHCRRFSRTIRVNFGRQAFGRFYINKQWSRNIFSIIFFQKEMYADIGRERLLKNASQYYTLR